MVLSAINNGFGVHSDHVHYKHRLSMVQDIAIDIIAIYGSIGTDTVQTVLKTLGPQVPSPVFIVSHVVF